MFERFSATIDTIYAAAIGESSWHDALRSIEDVTGSVGAVIGFVPTGQGEAAFNLAGRFTAEQCATYSDLYQPICRRTRYMIDHPERDVIYDALLITEREMDRDPVYDWFAQHGLRYFVGSALPPTNSHAVVFSLQRSPSQGHVQRDDILMFKRISTHLGRAVALASQLGSLRSTNRFNSAVLHALSQAVFALGPDGVVLDANDTALKLLAKGDGLSVANGCLRGAVATEQGELDALIREAASLEIAAGGGWTKLSRPGGGPAYAVFVAPLAESGEQLFSTPARVLVVVHDLSAHPSADVRMLAAVYGLTNTEGRLASAIAAGHSLESAAGLLQIGLATARSHLKSIFAKLGVNRQQDLVRLLTALASLKA